MNKPETRPHLQLSGQNGNAFVILGLAKRAARKSDWTDEQFDEFQAEATSSDYDHLLSTCQDWFEVD